MTYRFNLFGYEVALAFRRIREKVIRGITNETADGLMCVFIDYDQVPLKRIMAELERIQEYHDLGSFFIFKSSSDGFHAVCFDKVTFHEHLEILRQTSTDESFLDVPSKYGRKCWTLRLTPKNNVKPVYLGCILREGKREQSTAHANLFRERNKECEDIKLIKPDDRTKLSFAQYKI